MSVTDLDVQRLALDTPRDQVKQRQGPGGRMLDYVDARFVMDRLDELGPSNWQDRYEDRPNGSVRCGIGINVDGEWIWKWDVGDESDIEADKGAHSGAFKRAGVKWGIARDLYGHPNTVTGGGRGPSSTARPPARPTVVPDDPTVGLPLDDEFAPIGGHSAPAHIPTDMCPIHNERWRGDPGDLYHGPKGVVEGGYCRHPDNVKKARRA